jgi:hypothetical protein
MLIQTCHLMHHPGHPPSPQRSLAPLRPAASSHAQRLSTIALVFVGLSAVQPIFTVPPRKRNPACAMHGPAAPRAPLPCTLALLRRVPPRPLDFGDERPSQPSPPPGSATCKLEKSPPRPARPTRTPLLLCNLTRARIAGRIHPPPPAPRPAASPSASYPPCAAPLPIQRPSRPARQQPPAPASPLSRFERRERPPQAPMSPGRRAGDEFATFLLTAWSGRDEHRQLLPCLLRPSHGPCAHSPSGASPTVPQSQLARLRVRQGSARLISESGCTCTRTCMAAPQGDYSGVILF